MSSLDFVGGGLAGLGSFLVDQDPAVQSQAAHRAAIEAQQVAAAHLHMLEQSTSGHGSFDTMPILPKEFYKPPAASSEPRVLSDLEMREAMAKKKDFPWREI